MSTAIRLLVGLGIPALLVERLGADGVLDGLRAITAGTVLVALAVGVLTTVAGAARWCLVARGLGLTLPLGEAVADTYRAALLNSLLPAGVLGDVHRAVRHHRRAGDGRGARAVVLERVAGQGVVFGVGAAVLLVEPALLRALLPGAAAAVTVATLLLGAAGLAGWLLLARRAARWRVGVVGLLGELRLLARRTGPGCSRSRSSRWSGTWGCSSSPPARPG